jgi:hypothetical protein
MRSRGKAGKAAEEMIGTLAEKRADTAKPSAPQRLTALPRRPDLTVPPCLSHGIGRVVELAAREISHQPTREA